MKFLHRRQFLHLAAGAAALPTLPHTAQAQAYPSRPVRIIVPAAVGGASDILARLIDQRLTERLRQTFVIENRQGAGGNIAAEAVVRAPADGYMLLAIKPTYVINPTLDEKLNYNFIRDIAPVASIDREPPVMVAIRRFRPRLFLSSSPKRAHLGRPEAKSRPSRRRPENRRHRKPSPLAKIRSSGPIGYPTDASRRR
jgi:hypothetical protein